jgi:hypothetical protein
MEHFGFQVPGSKFQVEKVHILGRVEKLFIKTMLVRPIHPRTLAVSLKPPREMSREQCGAYYYSNNDDALITVPQVMVKALWLFDYVLTEEQVAMYEEKVRKFNPVGI